MAAGVVEGVVEEPEPSPPPNKPPVAGGLEAGGGPAGVVDALPNNDPPAGAGVDDEAALPNRDPEAAPEPAPPKRFPPPVVGVAFDCAGLGVEEPPNEGVVD